MDRKILSFYVTYNFNNLRLQIANVISKLIFYVPRRGQYSEMHAPIETLQNWTIPIWNDYPRILIDVFNILLKVEWHFQEREMNDRVASVNSEYS